MAYLREMRAAQAGGFAELAFEGKEVREREQAGAGGRKRERGELDTICQRKRNRSGSWRGEQLSGDVKV